MNNKGVGAVFCLISAILASAWYITTATFMSGTPSWSADFFKTGLDYVGSSLKIWAIIALVAGICFLGLGIVQDLKKKDK